MVLIMNFALFKLKDVFVTKKFKKYASFPVYDDDNIVLDVPFISASDENNGVSGYVTDSNISFVPDDIYICCLTLSTNGKCFSPFLHQSAISASTDVEILVHPKLNLYNGLYLVSVLRLFQKHELFSYGFKPKNNKIYETKIALPITNTGEIDWQFMTDYMKQIIHTQLNLFTTRI